MSALARWCVRRRFVVLGTWFALVLVLAGAALSLGAKFTDVTTPPDSESARAYALMGQVGGGEASAEGQGTIVWRTNGTDVDAPTVRTTVEAMLAKVDALPGVESVVSPYDEAGATHLDADRDVAFATLSLTDAADAADVKKVATSLDGPTYQVEVGGRAFYEQPAAGGVTEIVGILGALVVLLLAFRSAWAAILPIVTGVVGVATSLLLVMLASHQFDLASSTPTMGALIGLGVGIDYALFIVYRTRKAMMDGASVHDAVVEAVNTSGRAVLFAGGTVVIALVGMFVVQIDILTGMARAAAVTVLFTVAAAVTLLPALLAVLGRRVLSGRQRRDLVRAEQLRAEAIPGQAVLAPETTSGPRASLADRWANLVERRPRMLAAVAMVVMVALAIPALSIRLGSADASSDPADSDTHQYYAMMADSFGDGFDAPLLVVAETPDAASSEAFARLVTAMGSTTDVASASAATPAGSPVSVATVTPAKSAQSERTADLVHRLRDQVIPRAETGTDMTTYVGGITASNIDVAQATTSKLPIYLVLIAALGFVLLAVAFRSILVPLIGAVANLFTLAVGLGALTAVFQSGLGSELLGVGGAAPIESLVPVLLFGVMFGLSMDYQVFLVSRMHEEWTQTGRNAHSIRVGLRETAGVITAAAVIMLCVFAAFGFAGQRIIAEIGIALAVAVLADAFVMRLTVVPALMHLIGDRNWAYPRVLERVTPRMSIEGTHADAPAPDATPDADELDLVPAGGVQSTHAQGR